MAPITIQKGHSDGTSAVRCRDLRDAHTLAGARWRTFIAAGCMLARDRQIPTTGSGPYAAGSFRSRLLLRKENRRFRRRSDDSLGARSHRPICARAYRYNGTPGSEKRGRRSHLPRRLSIPHSTMACRSAGSASTSAATGGTTGGWPCASIIACPSGPSRNFTNSSARSGLGAFLGMVTP